MEERRKLVKEICETHGKEKITGKVSERDSTSEELVGFPKLCNSRANISGNIGRGGQEKKRGELKGIRRYVLRKINT